MKTKLLIFSIAAVLVCACGDGKKKEQKVQATETKTEKPKTEENMDTKIKEAPNVDVDYGKEPVFDIVTSEGTIRVKLYNDTPKHRDNFARLAISGYYNGTLFHRVINGFMIQGGDPESKNAPASKRLGVGGPDYKLNAEITSKHNHKKGALAAARQGDNVNPEKKSSGSQFYIVQDAKACAQLDGAYTVFGETVSGLDIVDKIAKVAVDANDRPTKDVKIEKIVLVK